MIYSQYENNPLEVNGESVNLIGTTYNFEVLLYSNIDFICFRLDSDGSYRYCYPLACPSSDVYY